MILEGWCEADTNAAKVFPTLSSNQYYTVNAETWNGSSIHIVEYEESLMQMRWQRWWECLARSSHLKVMYFKIMQMLNAIYLTSLPRKTNHRRIRSFIVKIEFIIFNVIWQRANLSRAHNGFTDYEVYTPLIVRYLKQMKIQSFASHFLHNCRTFAAEMSVIKNCDTTAIVSWVD